MKFWKLALIITGILAACCILFGLALWGMVYHISHRLDCERFNIDNVELRTETNIPDLAENPVCGYDPKLKVKANLFHIDTRQVDMHHYIVQNHFSKLNTGKRGQYIGKESGNMDSWLYVLDSASGKMWMEIVRSKHH